MRLRCRGATWLVSPPYKAFVTLDAQLRGLAEPAAEPALPVLPELPSARGGGDARHAARLHALQAWLDAVCRALGFGRLGAHAPLSRVLELHVPLLIRLQACGRGLVVRRRRGLLLAASRSRGHGDLAAATQLDARI